MQDATYYPGKVKLGWLAAAASGKASQEEGIRSLFQATICLTLQGLPFRSRKSCVRTAVDFFFLQTSYGTATPPREGWRAAQGGDAADTKRTVDTVVVPRLYLLTLLLLLPSCATIAHLPAVMGIMILVLGSVGSPLLFVTCRSEGALPSSTRAAPSATAAM